MICPGVWMNNNTMPASVVHMSVWVMIMNIWYLQVCRLSVIFNLNELFRCLDDQARFLDELSVRLDDKSKYLDDQYMWLYEISRYLDDHCSLLNEPFSIPGYNAKSHFKWRWCLGQKLASITSYRLNSTGLHWTGEWGREGWRDRERELFYVRVF